MSSFSRTSWRKGTKVEMKFEGLQELVFELQNRNELVAKKAIRTAVLRGGRLLRDAAKKYVPVESQTLKESLGLRSKRYASNFQGTPSNINVAIIGPRVAGYKFTNIVIRSKGKWFAQSQLARPEKYAHLVALGTKKHRIRDTKNGGAIIHPGTAAKPFMERAALATTSAVRSAMEKTLTKAIQGEESFADLVLSEG